MNIYLTHMSEFIWELYMFIVELRFSLYQSDDDPKFIYDYKPPSNAAGESGDGSTCCLVRHTPVSCTVFALLVPVWLHCHGHLSDILNTHMQQNLPRVPKTGIKNMILITFFNTFSIQIKRSTTKRDCCTNLLFVHMTFAQVFFNTWYGKMYRIIYNIGDTSRQKTPSNWRTCPNLAKPAPQILYDESTGKHSWLGNT